MTTESFSNIKTLGDWASLAIEKHFEKTLGHEAAVLKDEDPEELHQMRVGMRRLRSAMTGFAAVIELPQQAGDKQVGKISRCLGKLRDLDVLGEALRERYFPNLPPKEQGKLKPVFVQFNKQRHQIFKEVRDTLNSKSYQRLKKTLQNWLENPIYTEISYLPIQEVLPDLLLPQISQLFLHPGWMVGTHRELGEITVPLNSTIETVEKELAIHGNIVHNLRKQVKQVRYQMSLFLDFYGPSYETYVKDMKAIQESLGDIQDSQVLTEFLSDILTAEIGKMLPALAEQLRQNRYQAWVKWQPLQQQYLNPQTRQNCRFELLQPTGRGGVGE